MPVMIEGTEKFILRVSEFRSSQNGQRGDHCLGMDKLRVHPNDLTIDKLIADAVLLKADIEFFDSLGGDLVRPLPIKVFEFTRMAVDKTKGELDRIEKTICIGFTFKPIPNVLI